MKYMTFNNSCLYAGIANLLESFNVDINDQDIIRNTIIPYIFKIDEQGSFLSGYQIQNFDVINDYLKQYIVRINEKQFRQGSIEKRKLDLIESLKNTEKDVIVSLKRSKSDRTWHVTIYKEFKNSKFHFLNMRREDEDLEKIELTDMELFDLIADNTQYAYIEKTNYFDVINKRQILENSLKVVDKYQREIQGNMKCELSFEERVDDRDTLYKALLLNYIDISKILGEEKLYIDLKLLQKQYIKSFKDKDKIKLEKYLSKDLLNKSFKRIKTLIKENIETKYYHGSKVSGIKELQPNMSIHGKKYVYLTTKKEVALIYTVNAIESFYEKEGLEKPEKFHPWYSYGFYQGKLQIEEYYPNAFKETYEGKSGYLYIAKEPKIYSNETNIYCAITTENKVVIKDEIFIEDIYEYLLELERNGQIFIRRFTDTNTKTLEYIKESVRQSIEYFDLMNRPEYHYTIFLKSKFPELFIKTE